MPDKVDQIVEENPDVWKTRSSFFSWIKGTLRKGWSHHPIKLKLIKKVRKQIPNPNPNGNKPTVWGATCSICDKDYVLKEIQIDHKLEGTAFLTEIEHIQSCAEKLLLVTEEDLQPLCKECNSTRSLAQKQGISFEEALIRKQVVAFGKLPVNEMLNVLTASEKYETIASEIKQKETKKHLIQLYEKMLKGE